MLTRLIKLRLARPVKPKTYRTFSSPTHSDPPAPLPHLSSLHLPETPTQPFPLYQPPPPRPPPSRYADLPTTLDSLPSDRALQIRQKLKLTQAVERSQEEYTEEQLREFYAAVVQSGPEAEAISGEEDGRARLGGPSELKRISSAGIGGGVKLGEEEVRNKVLSGLAARFLPSLGDGVEVNEGEKVAIAQSGVGLRDIVDTLAKFAEEDEMSSGSSSSPTGLRVPLGLLSRLESRTLLQESVRQGDTATLVNLLEILPRVGVLVEREQVVELLDGIVSAKLRQRKGLGYAEEETVLVLAGITGQQGQLQPAEQDALVRTHLLTDPSATSSIAHLRSFESTPQPAPQSSYNLVLTHLTTQSPTSITRSTAWDLFTHMRLVAHPHPSPEVYSTMIASCAASSDPKPELARDLWIQMTQEQRISPGEREYTAYIRSLCSTRGTYLEGFDVFRQMLARHHEATYVPFGGRFEGEDMGGGEVERESMSRYIPTKETWKALLEGTKRAGDLSRARWVLQECIKLHAALGGMKGMGVDEDVMASVFMTYAAWKPTLRRVVVREKEGGVGTKQKESGEAERMETEQQRTEWNEEDDLDVTAYSDTQAETEIDLHSRGGMFSSHPPVTSADALREASILFDALLPSPSSSQAQHTIFSDVTLTTRLLNSYLSVTYAHAPSISDCRVAWDALSPYYDTTGGAAAPGRNGWSYLHALERCSVGQRSRSSGVSAAEDRAASLSWAQSLWKEYITLSQTLLRRLHSSPQPGLAYSLGISPRQTERAWRSIIRVHALNDDPTMALDLLSQFHELYPPDHITQAYTPSKEHGFSIRFTDPTTVAEADVPPHILWRDVDVLHQRLVRDERWNEVGRVKWVCASYEAALKKRRRWRLDGVGKRRELGRGRGRGVDVQGDHAGEDDGVEIEETGSGWGVEEAHGPGDGYGSDSGQRGRRQNVD